MTFITKSFKIDLEHYNKLVEVCTENRKRISTCIRNVISLSIEGKIKPIQTKSDGIEEKRVWFRIDRNEYQEFKNICEKLGYDSFSKCVRDAVIMWLDSTNKLKKGKTVIKTVAISDEDYRRLSLICDKRGYVSTSKCAKEALLFLISMQNKAGDKNDAKLKFPYKVVKINMKMDEYINYYNECKKLGYKSFSKCVRHAIKLWLDSQKVVK